MNTEVLMYGLTASTCIIAFFLRSIHSDFKTLVESVTEMNREIIRLAGKITQVEQKANGDISTLKELTNEKLNTIIDHWKEQTEMMKDMKVKLEHLDANTANVKIFFQKYEAVEDRQINLEARMKTLEA